MVVDVVVFKGGGGWLVGRGLIWFGLVWFRFDWIVLSSLVFLQMDAGNDSLDDQGGDDDDDEHGKGRPPSLYHYTPLSHCSLGP